MQGKSGLTGDDRDHLREHLKLGINLKSYALTAAEAELIDLYAEILINYCKKCFAREGDSLEKSPELNVAEAKAIKWHQTKSAGPELAYIDKKHFLPMGREVCIKFKILIANSIVRAENLLISYKEEDEIDFNKWHAEALIDYYRSCYDKDGKLLSPQPIPNDWETVSIVWYQNQIKDSKTTDIDAEYIAPIIRQDLTKFRRFVCTFLDAKGIYSLVTLLNNKDIFPVIEQDMSRFGSFIGGLLGTRASTSSQLGYASKIAVEEPRDFMPLYTEKNIDWRERLMGETSTQNIRDK